ncbi:GNAT family N-acetyltransferase [Listeria monocytogenes]|nr:GNAT family N-acetyltransferase [Listeria monocytogenes]EAD7580711.1 GNAT family N-acetyltransferase [Listeria monocytogenes]EAE8037297.1 GNAT family N-acetyltransferase [Listeria monocytogenes]EAE8046401.1 GNAT family N-acetyltransferase [Listeria monocytogenes]EAF8492220.1 GNAT family N-acetyltransferase [Listeria monocytogenes]
MIEDQREELRQLYFISRKDTFLWEDKIRFEDFDQDTKDELILVATIDEKVVGFISLYIEDHFIHCLFVTPEKKGFGIGTLLLEEAKKVLKRPMKLKCLSRNIAAINFYESKGWEKIEEVRFENENDNYWNFILDEN